MIDQAKKREKIIMSKYKKKIKQKQIINVKSAANSYIDLYIAPFKLRF